MFGGVRVGIGLEALARRDHLLAREAAALIGIEVVVEQVQLTRIRQLVDQLADAHPELVLVDTLVLAGPRPRGQYLWPLVESTPQQ